MARRLNVDLDELTYAFENASWEISQYLDLETGQVILIMDETRSLLDSIYEERWDEATDGINLESILATMELYEWQKEAVREANQVEVGYNDRYISVPKVDSHEGYRDMQAFIGTVLDERLAYDLEYAISGRRPFRAFKDVLYRHPAHGQRWYAFKERVLRERVIDWLNSRGIEPIIEPMTNHDEAKNPESIRALMIDEVLKFISAARDLSGIIHIALIGSLATDKPEPKDVDLLVMVTDDMDLNPLATLARKLNGHLQSRNHNSEVFLMNPAGDYLGRVCHWKRCGPGIRASCDAQNCGRRHYLHDDLQDVQLSKELIAEPPFELWPHVVTRTIPPEDIQKRLLDELE